MINKYIYFFMQHKGLILANQMLAGEMGHVDNVASISAPFIYGIIT